MAEVVKWLAADKRRNMVLGQGTFEGKWCWFCMLRGKNSAGTYDISAQEHGDTAESAISKALLAMS